MSDLLTRLIEAGTPAALVAEVAMLAARAETAGQAIEQRRAKDRVRQSTRRHAMSRDVTLDSVTTCDTADEPAPSPPPLLSPQTPQTTPPPHPHPEENILGTRKAWACPVGVNPGHWRDILANRKRKRMANTPTAYQHLLGQLDRLSDDEWPPPKLIEHAAAHGWAAIHDPRASETRNGKRPHRDRPSAWGGSHLPLGAVAADLDQD